MSHRPLTSPVIKLADLGLERRGPARFALDLETMCRRSGATSRDAHPGKISNISMTGLAVSIPWRFEEGSELTLDMPETPQTVAGLLHVRVMNVRALAVDSWLHGCVFVGHSSGGDMTAAFRFKWGKPIERERRALLRYPFAVPATARAVTAALNEAWTGTTYDISAGGLRLSANAGVKPGTLLTIKVQADASAGARTLMARVMHASSGPSGWELGCMFNNRLAHDELQALLKEGLARSQKQSKGKPDATAALKLALADQIERNLLGDAQRTVTELLRLRPKDPDGLAAREFLECLLSPLPSSAEARCLRGHRASVNAVTFYAGGRYAISAGGVDDEMQRDLDNSVRFWDLAAGFELHTFTGHKTPVTGISVPQRGTRALTASKCSSIFLWDVERRAVIRQFELHGRGTNCAAISSGGKWALTGCEDAILRIWDADLGRCLRRFSGHEGPITACVFLPDDHAAVSASMDRTIRIWTFDSAHRHAVLSGHSKGVLSLALSADGRHVISGSADNTVRIWNLLTRSEVARLEGHENVVNAVAFSPSGKRIASASADNTIRLWDIERAEEIGCLTGHTASVRCIAFSPDGRRLLSGSSDHTVRLWDLPDEK